MSDHIEAKAQRFLDNGMVREVEAVYAEDREFRVGPYSVTVAPNHEVLCTCRGAEFGHCSHAEAALWYAEGGKERAA